MRSLLLAALLSLAACKNSDSTDAKPTDDADADADADSDSDTDTDSDSDSDSDSDTETDPGTEPPPAQPQGAAMVSGGGTVASPRFSLDVSVGDPITAQSVSSTRFKAKVGVGQVVWGP